MSKVVDKPDGFHAWLMTHRKIDLAIRLGVDTATVARWKSRHTLPTHPHMIKIIALAKGEIGYADIIEPFYQRNPHLLARAANA